MPPRLIIAALLGTTLLPAAARAQFLDYTVQIESTAGLFTPGFNRIFKQGEVVGATRAVVLTSSPTVGGRFLFLIPQGLYSGIAVVFAPSIDLENNVVGNKVGVASRFRVSVVMGGQTPPIPGTPISFRGGFDIGLTHYSFDEDPGVSFPVSDATNFFAGLSFGTDVELAGPVSLVADAMLPFEKGQTQSLANFLIHAGVALRLPFAGR